MGPATAESTELKEGLVLGDTYRIDKLLGRGGMGAVWGASHLRLPGKRVAIKVLLVPADSATGGESYARFRREAEIVSRIGHPNIVEVIDWNTLPDGRPYLVLEYLEGESLAARLERGPLPLEETLEIARQIGSALAAAHRAGVVHRDLKPENVFLCPTDSGGTLGDRVKVLDFGVSKIKDSSTIQTQEARILGTPQYMAPEQVAGARDVDARADVFALGAMVYEMLSGRAAFAAENLPLVVFKVVYEDPPPLAVAGLPAQVTAAVTRALAKDPKARFADMPGFLLALSGRPLASLSGARKPAPELAYARTLASEDVYGATIGAVAPKKRRRTAVWVAAGVLAVAGAAAALVALRPGAPSAPAATGPAASREVSAGTSNAPPAAAGVGGHLPHGSDVTASAPTSASAPASASASAGSAKPAGAPPAVAGVGGHISHGSDSKPSKPEEALPVSLLRDLADAEAAIAASEWKKADHVADRTIYVRKTSEAFSIKTRARCGMHDLEGAKIFFPSVRPRDRPQVIRFCKGFGVDLP